MTGIRREGVSGLLDSLVSEEALESDALHLRILGTPRRCHTDRHVPGCKCPLFIPGELAKVSLLFLQYVLGRAQACLNRYSLKFSMGSKCKAARSWLPATAVKE